MVGAKSMWQGGASCHVGAKKVLARKEIRFTGGGEKVGLQRNEWKNSMGCGCLILVSRVIDFFL